ncbi:MAG TPA: CCA tRNA nucleotidyltransferase, partial [Nitrospiria bacterium]
MATLREKAVSIVKTLRKAGYEAYWAGGSVRDLVMGNEPDDYDIATSAPPDAVMKLFKQTIPVGVSFGVVRVRLDEDEFEVAAFRSDGRYIDGRHPETVTFSDAREDAKRRDFTINGMFYDPEEEKVIDYVEGQADIKKGVIRAIGDAGKRFEEDRLRMIRAVRFSARFGFPIEPETEKALRGLSDKIPSISGERIRDELEKMLCGANPAQAFRLLHKTGILKVILPEVVAMDGVEQPPQFHPEGDVLTHTFLLLENLREPSFELALAALLHDIGKPPTFTVSDRIRFNNHCEVGEKMTLAVCRRLRLSNEQTRVVAELVRDHLRFKDVKQMRVSTLK